MDACPPFTPLPQSTEAPASSFAFDAMTARRVALLMDMATDARTLARRVRTQAEACSWVDPKDGGMFARFDRAVRQSIMLAAKLEADARRLGPPAVARDTAVPFAFDAMTMRRTALLMDVAEDARMLGRRVCIQAERWVDPNDAALMDRFDRAARQSIMLADKLEADARRVAAGKPEAAEKAFVAQARIADAGPTPDRRQAGSQLHGLDTVQAIEGLSRLQPMDALPDAPVGVVVAKICRLLKRRQDMSGFTDAELGHDRERWQRVASGPPRPIPDGWIEGVNGELVKIGADLTDVFMVGPRGASPRRVGRDPPD